MTDDMAMTTAMTNVDTDTDMAMATMVTVEEAARLAGVSPRTVRRWIQHGALPCIETTERGKLVSPADLPAARLAARSGHGHVRDRDRRDRDHGHGHGHEGVDTAMATDTTAVSVSPAARSQLEAIRDEWLRPLMERNEDLARENGRLQAERDAALAEVERLKAAQDASVAAPESQHGAQPAETAPDTSPPWWASWWRRLFGLDR
ncbi:MAG: helix-turn-helix domain-containing protein [Chloroflexota bacterium]|nr:helix-turn-helix domain-containing protein [Chloroflexota bacterium]